MTLVGSRSVAHARSFRSGIAWGLSALFLLMMTVLSAASAQEPILVKTTTWSHPRPGYNRGLAYDGIYYYLAQILETPQIDIYDDNGLVKSIPKPANADYLWPHGVAVDGEQKKIWTTDYFGRTIFEIDFVTGAVLRTTPFPVNGNPVRMDYDRVTQTLWLSVYGDARIYNVSMQGALLRSFVTSGYGNNRGIALDGAGNLLVADGELQARPFRRYSPTGVLLEELSGSFAQWDIATNVNDRGAGFLRPSRGQGDDYRIEHYAFDRPAGDTAWLSALGDTNGDDTPEIAVVARADGKNRASIADAATGSLISQFEFSASMWPVAVEAMSDSGLGNTLVPSLVMLGEDPAVAETRDVPSGDLLGTVAFDLSGRPVDLAVLPDQNGNGSPEFAMLAAGSTAVEVRDAATGALLNTLSFPATFTPRQVLALPDLNGNASAEVGVVLLSTQGKADRVVIKDTGTGAVVQTLWSDRGLLQAERVADRNGNGAPEVALLWRNQAAGTTHVWVVDAATGQRLAALAGFHGSATPFKLAVVADITGDGIEEYAVLGRKPDTGQVTATIQDGATGQWVNRIWYSKTCTPLDLASIADVNGNGAAELVMLGRCGPNARLRAVVNEIQSGQVLRRLDF